MSDIVIQIDSLWKKYRLGVLGTGTLRHDLNRWWHRVRGKPDPYSKIGEAASSSAVTRNQAGDPLPLADDEIWALRDISFEVNRGEILGVIGHNGAGKSTLLKVLSRVTAPTFGEIRAKGRIASLLEVGTGFHPELTGRENIFLNGAILGMSKSEIRAKLDEIVAFAEIQEFIDTPVKRYSSGMYVRLAFAVAAHLEPEILIVDEVLAVGDVQFQRKCLGKMGDVARCGRTVIFVSHNMDAMLSLCVSCLVMSSGTCSQRMPPRQAVSQYLSAKHASDQKTLAERPRYQHKAREPIFCDLRISCDTPGIPTVPSGASIDITIEMRSFADVRNARCGILVTTQTGQRIAAFQTWYQAGLLFDGASKRVLTCKIPSLPLVPGTYSMDLVLGDDYQIIERVEGAATLNVVFRDVFGTGKLPGEGQGFLALPCEWQLIK